MDTWFPTFRRFAEWCGSLRFWIPSLPSSGQHHSLLRLIAVATEENVPLAPLVESWAADERGSQRHRLFRLARLLEDGTPLPDAVEQIPGLLCDEEVLAIRFGSQSGTLTASVRAMLDDSQPASGSPPSHIRHPFVYFGTVLLIGIPLVAYTQISIIPSLHDMHREFSLDDSQILRQSTQLSAFFASFWWVIVLAVFFLLWVTFSERPGRFVRRSIFGRFFRLHREKGIAGLLEQLSVVLDAGRPIPGTLSTLARYHFDPVIRRKLLFVRNEVEQGSAVWQAMANVGLLTSPEVRLMKTAERIGNRPWVLRQLAFAKKRQNARSLERISRCIPPALVIVLGIFVLLEAATVFLPLTRMILGLA